MNRNMKVPAGLLLAMLVLSGCSKPADHPPVSKPGDVAAQQRGDRADNGNDQEEERSADDRDPCQLLSASEAQTILGTLAVPPYTVKDGEPSKRGDGCEYLAADRHSMIIEVQWEGAQAVLKMMGIPGQVMQALAPNAPPGVAVPAPGAAGGMLHKKDGGATSGASGNLHAGVLPKELLPYDIPYAGEWDDMRVIGCCRYIAFLGDASVELNFGASKATPAQAVDLINKALLRLGKPLSDVEGMKGVAAAKEKLAEFARHRKACDMVSRAEAETIVGKLSADPAGDDESCEYRYHSGVDAEGTGSDEVVRVKFQWTGGFAGYRDEAFMEKASDNVLPGIGGMSDQAAKAGEMMSQFKEVMQQPGGGSFDSLGKAVQQMARKAEGKKTATPDAAAANDKSASANKSPQFEGPWEAARFSFPEFKAVKKDVQISVEAGTSPKISQQFASKAMEKL